jgi:predicted metallopeptidase
MNVDELLARWPTEIPMKGKLIDPDGCMCAQGQVLHYVGGLTPDDLREMEQDDADRQTAELLGISRAHAVLLRVINDDMPGAPTCVLTEPEKVLGEQAQRVLAFWRHIDRLTTDDWQKVAAHAAAHIAAYDAAAYDAYNAAVRAADATYDAARAADAAYVAAADAARAAAAAVRAAYAYDAYDTARAVCAASNEIQGAAIMRERGQPFFFLHMFGFASPEDIV